MDVNRSIIEMRGMLRFYYRIMVYAHKSLVYVIRHGEIDIFLIMRSLNLIPQKNHHSNQ